MPAKLFKRILQHKVIIVIVLLLIIGGGYFGYKKFKGNGEEVRYVLSSVERGTIISSVSGSGQVAASEQIDVKPKVSGDVSAVYVVKGEEVKAGKLIARLDDSDFQKAVRDAETSLETAKLELEELLSPPDTLALFQAENSLTQAKQSEQKAQDNIEKAYEDCFNAIANTFLDLPAIITSVRDILYSYEIDESETRVNSQDNVAAYRNIFFGQNRDILEPFVKSAESDYKKARENYDQNLQRYKNTTRYSDRATIEALLDETLETTKLIAEAVKSEANLLDVIVDYCSDHNLRVYSKVTEYQATLKTNISKTNSQISNLLSMRASLKDDKDALPTAERTITEKELSLAKLKAGPDELAVRAKKIALQQKEEALQTAKQNIDDCSIEAPFDGIVADIKVKKGDTVSAGTVLATVVTHQKIAEISLNEVDVAKVKAAQKATLTFDALPDVTISGRILEVDTVGEVSQGVVSYGVKIVFDTQLAGRSLGEGGDDRVKPGMSVAADIITDVKQDVLLVPNNAVKSQGDSYFVEIVEVPEGGGQQLLANTSGVILPNLPRVQTVEIGVASDLSTEIVSGLQEGDVVVASTINSSQNQSSQARGNQGFQMPIMGGQRESQMIRLRD